MLFQRPRSTATIDDMQHHWLALVLSVAVVGMPCAARNATAQEGGSSSESTVARVVPIKLTRPVYPQIAQSARVRGFIVVDIWVQPDGHVASTTVLRSAPLLEQAALDAMRSSTFECRGCTAATTPYTLVYSFEFDDGSSQGGTLVDGIRSTPFQSHIKTTAEMPQISGGRPSPFAVRSAKCLYLWQCGVVEPWKKYGRSARCLWLWKCHLEGEYSFM
jgi:TonB family protein